MMHKIIPINCINKCVICFDHTLQKNSCVQCNVCFLCKKCSKNQFECCPMCRKEDFRKKKNEGLKCFKLDCLEIPILRKVLVSLIMLILCLFLGTFLRMISGDFSLNLLDIFLNIILGVFILSLFLMLDMCCGCKFCGDIEC